jgi:alginate O-acetyltransferase complex protein AlgI
VIFRATSFPQALAFLSNMLGTATPGAVTQPLARYVTHESVFALIAGAVFATPVIAWVKSTLSRAVNRLPHPACSALTTIGMTLEAVITIGLLLISSAWLAGSTYNPFIYFRF